MTIHYRCDAPACADPNATIRATRLVDTGETYTSASGRVWRKCRRTFIDLPTASGADWWRRAKTDAVIDYPDDGIENDFFASSEACADAIDAIYPEP